MGLPCVELEYRGLEIGDWYENSLAEKILTTFFVKLKSIA